MSPKPPVASASLSEDDIVDAVANIDANIAALLQSRIEQLSCFAGTDDAAKVSQAIASVQMKVAMRRDNLLKNGADTRAIFQAADVLCRSEIAPVTVAFLGPLGTYTHDAAVQHFGVGVEAMPVEAFAGIFQAVENGDADFGVAAIENSTEGAVNQTHDLLIDSDVSICGEVRLRIRHCLMSQHDNLANIKSVHAHPQALAQCRKWLTEHLPGAELISESSNAAAAELAADNADGVAAIASASAAERYNLQRLANGIEDVTNNTTRFIVIGRHKPAPTGHDASSLLISAPHKPGGLRRILQPLEDAGVSMTRIESRPGRTQLWEYVFFIDVRGHCDDPSLAAVLQQLQEETPLVRVLGSYPRAEPPS